MEKPKCKVLVFPDQRGRPAVPRPYDQIMGRLAKFPDPGSYQGFKIQDTMQATVEEMSKARRKVRELARRAGSDYTIEKVVLSRDYFGRASVRVWFRKKKDSLTNGFFRDTFMLHASL